jgi:elongation factor P
MKASDIRRGHVIMVDGQPCRVMDFQHRTPGNLRAFVQVRFRNLNSGNTFDTRLSATEFVEDARLDTKELQVLYRDGNGVHVMDAGTYDQYTLDEETVGDQGQWLEPGLTFQVEWLGPRPIAIQLPAVAELEVVETAPVMKTATKTASTKPAKLSNGVTIQVPEFIGEGERVRVNHKATRRPVPSPACWSPGSRPNARCWCWLTPSGRSLACRRSGDSGSRPRRLGTAPPPPCRCWGCCAGACAPSGNRCGGC